MTEPLLGTLILALVTAQRLAEVVYVTENTRRLVAHGAILVPRDATATLVGLHVLWIAAALAERTFLGERMHAAGTLPILLVLALVETLRASVLGTLGRRWTIRVVVVPGETPNRRGPYAFLRHPNYVVVFAELLLVPLLVGAWRTAIAVAIPGLLALRRRIAIEEHAWATHARPLRGPAAGAGPA